MMKTLKCVGALLAALFLISQNAEAGQFYTLDYRSQGVSPGMAVDLRADLEAIYPELKDQDLDFISMRVETKAYEGPGEVFFRLGDGSYSFHRIWGNTRDWNHPEIWNRLHFNDHRRWADPAPWALEFYGNHFRLRRVTVELEVLGDFPSPVPYPPERPRPVPAPPTPSEPPPPPTPRAPGRP